MKTFSRNRKMSVRYFPTNSKFLTTFSLLRHLATLNSLYNAQKRSQREEQRNIIHSFQKYLKIVPDPSFSLKKTWISYAWNKNSNIRKFGFFNMPKNNNKAEICESLMSSTLMILLRKKYIKETESNIRRTGITNKRKRKKFVCIQC